MANTKFTGRSDSYIFEDAGGKRDQLEQAILSELQAKQYPLKATIQTLKGGKGLMGAVFAAKEQCVVVDVDSEAKIAISNTTVGTYLYVEVWSICSSDVRVAHRDISSSCPHYLFGRTCLRNLSTCENQKARTVCFVGSRDYALAFCLLLNRTDQSCSCSEKFLDVYLVLSV